MYIVSVWRIGPLDENITSKISKQQNKMKNKHQCANSSLQHTYTSHFAANMKKNIHLFIPQQQQQHKQQPQPQIG